MPKKLLNIYKLELLISVTLAIALIALNVFKSPTIILGISLGTLLGTFILDLDYFIYAYFFDPEKPFSKTLRAYVTHKDIPNALNHIYYNREEVKEKTLNSVLFQIVLAGICLFTAASTSGVFVKALVLSTFANSIYKMADNYLDGKAGEWFWALKKIPNQNGILAYGLILVGVLIYSILLF